MGDMEIEVNRDSLSYKIVTSVMGVREWELQGGYIDSCEYTRKTIIGAIIAVGLALLLLAALLSLLGMMGSTIGWLIACIHMRLLIEPHGLVIPMLSLLLIGCIIGLVFSINKLIKRVDKNKVPMFHPSEMKLYKAWKEKHCHRIVLK